jgi:hypothetical protein
MSTLKTTDCTKKGANIVCPSCGRSAPDWCGENQPETVETPALIPTGSDLPQEDEAQPAPTTKKAK